MWMFKAPNQVVEFCNSANAEEQERRGVLTKWCRHF